MSTIEELATRTFNNRCDSTNLVGRHIIDADCIYDNGAFVLKSLPENLPVLFTLRFTAPADYTQGDVVAIDEQQFPVRTPGMASASTGLYKAGAVVHCDIDLERELAFFWLGAGMSGGGVPNLSYDEQFAGFYDEEGDRVYVRTVLYGTMPNSAAVARNHNISNIKRIVNYNMATWNPQSPHGAHCSNYYLSSGSYICVTANVDLVRCQVGGDWRDHTLSVVMYYTCTDR